MPLIFIRGNLKKLDEASAVEIVDDEFFILANSQYYSEKTGIIFPDSGLGMSLFS